MAAVREIHEIELSSRCNLACVYCPHPKMERPKIDMAADVFDRSLWWIEKLCREGTQGEVAMTGIGEALLHPNFQEMAQLIRGAIGNRPLTMATNGILVTRGVADFLRSINCIVYVSLHRPEVAGKAVRLLSEAGVTHATNHAFVTSSIDWAGQVDWHVSMQRSACQYLRKGWAVVRADGRVTTCCMDAETKHSFGTVFFNTLETGRHSLCDSCSLDP